MSRWRRAKATAVISLCSNSSINRARRCGSTRTMERAALLTLGFYQRMLRSGRRSPLYRLRTSGSVQVVEPWPSLWAYTKERGTQWEQSLPIVPQRFLCSRPPALLDRALTISIIATPNQELRSVSIAPGRNPNSNLQLPSANCVAWIGTGRQHDQQVAVPGIRGDCQGLYIQLDSGQFTACFQVENMNPPTFRPAVDDVLSFRMEDQVFGRTDPCPDGRVVFHGLRIKSLYAPPCGTQYPGIPVGRNPDASVGCLAVDIVRRDNFWMILQTPSLQTTTRRRLGIGFWVRRLAYRKQLLIRQQCT